MYVLRAGEGTARNKSLERRGGGDLRYVRGALNRDEGRKVQSKATLIFLKPHAGG